MQTSVRRGYDLTRSTNEELITSKADWKPCSNENLTTCTSVGKLVESLPPGSGATDTAGHGSSSGSARDVSNCSREAPSKMARGVVWIFLFDGDTIVFLCSGIPIEHNPSCTKVLTTTNLAAAVRDKRKSSSAMKIQVRDAFNNVAPGCLEECELDHGIVGAAFVKVTGFLDVCEVHLRNGVEIPPCIVVVAIHFNDSGGATTVKEILNKGSTPSQTVICKADDGKPLFDGDGNFVGMDIFYDKGSRHVFVKGSVIFENLVEFANRIRVPARQQERYRRYMSSKGELRSRPDCWDLPVKRMRTIF